MNYTRVEQVSQAAAARRVRSAPLCHNATRQKRPAHGFD